MTSSRCDVEPRLVASMIVPIEAQSRLVSPMAMTDAGARPRLVSFVRTNDEILALTSRRLIHYGAGGCRPALSQCMAGVGPIIRNKPIRLLLPFPAGGTVDHVARLVTARMAEELGRPFVIENKAGAGGVIATDATAKARGGRLYAPAHHAQSHHQCRNQSEASLRHRKGPRAGRDPGRGPGIAREPSRPRRSKRSRASSTMRRKNPGKLNYASAGNGTLPHVTMELLLRRAGIEVAHIPYRGAAPAMTDLLAGQVQLKMDTYATANQLVADGKLRALAFAARAALGAHARRADRRRDGAAGIRGHPVDGHGGAGRDAAAGHRQARGSGATRGAHTCPRRTPQA